MKREGKPKAIPDPPIQSDCTPCATIRRPKIDKKRVSHIRSCTSPACRLPPTPRSEIKPPPQISVSGVPIPRIPVPQLQWIPDSQTSLLVPQPRQVPMPTRQLTPIPPIRMSTLRQRLDVPIQPRYNLPNHRDPILPPLSPKPPDMPIWMLHHEINLQALGITNQCGCH